MAKFGLFIFWAWQPWCILTTLIPNEGEGVAFAVLAIWLMWIQCEFCTSSLWRNSIQWQNSIFWGVGSLIQKLEMQLWITAALIPNEKNEHKLAIHNETVCLPETYKGCLSKPKLEKSLNFYVYGIKESWMKLSITGGHRNSRQIRSARSAKIPWILKPLKTM